MARAPEYELSVLRTCKANRQQIWKVWWSIATYEKLATGDNALRSHHITKVSHKLHAGRGQCVLIYKSSLETDLYPMFGEF